MVYRQRIIILHHKTNASSGMKDSGNERACLLHRHSLWRTNFRHGFCQVFICDKTKNVSIAHGINGIMKN